MGAARPISVWPEPGHLTGASRSHQHDRSSHAQPITAARKGTVMTTSTRTTTPVRSTVEAAPTGPLGRIIASSMATGVVAAAALTFAVLPDASEATIVGAALAAFGAGWAMLAWLTTRLTTRPQVWAYVPAAALGTSGAALLAFTPGGPTMTLLAWVWAPALVVLGAWITRRTRQRIPGRR